MARSTSFQFRGKTYPITWEDDRCTVPNDCPISVDFYRSQKHDDGTSEHSCWDVSLYRSTKHNDAMSTRKTSHVEINVEDRSLKKAIKRLENEIHQLHKKLRIVIGHDGDGGTCFNHSNVIGNRFARPL